LSHFFFPFEVEILCSGLLSFLLWPVEAACCLQVVVFLLLAAVVILGIGGFFLGSNSLIYATDRLIV
jgi:hypothetical protein